MRTISFYDQFYYTIQSVWCSARSMVLTPGTLDNSILALLRSHTTTLVAMRKFITFLLHASRRSGVGEACPVAPKARHARGR